MKFTALGKEISLPILQISLLCFRPRFTPKIILPQNNLVLKTAKDYEPVACLIFP